MNITFNDSIKDLPSDQLWKLFELAGNSDGLDIESIRAMFANSTLVVSAWHDKRLVGVARVLSDKIYRSIICDLVVLPEFQRMGIEKDLMKLSMSHYPLSDWFLETSEEIYVDYEKYGFKMNGNVFFSIPMIY